MCWPYCSEESSRPSTIAASPYVICKRVKRASKVLSDTPRPRPCHALYRRITSWGPSRGSQTPSPEKEGSERESRSSRKPHKQWALEDNSLLCGNGDTWKAAAPTRVSFGGGQTVLRIRGACSQTEAKHCSGGVAPR